MPSSDDPDRFAQYAERIFGIQDGTAEERARLGIDKMIAYFQSIGMPVSLKELFGKTLSNETINELADLATAGDTKKLGSFHPLAKEDVVAIYKLANH